VGERVLVERTDGVAVITINRPEARNAIDLATARGIADAIDLLDGDRDMSVGVLTGAGGTFCAGMDLKAFTRGERPVIEGRGFGGLTGRPPRKPLIAAVEGYALAGGFELALSADLVVAARDARFGLPEVKRGLVAGAGGLLRLPRTVSYQLAMEVALTGDMLEAASLHRHGLINRITEPGKALYEAVVLASRIAKNAPLAVAASKAIVALSAGWTDSELFDSQAGEVEPVLRSNDALEGARAFAEKRAPIWRGQ
jgi:enoyl-CoA hydratase